MPVVVFLARLKPGVDPAVYEQWVREVDYPRARRLPSVISYVNHRLHAPLRKADVRYDYLEILQVTDLDAYRQDLTRPEIQELRQQLMEFIEPSDNWIGEVIV
ncbi:MAG: RedY protein [Armatimonadota bacterium]|nr:RedY protein [Armatimonadota bacterium]